MPTRKTPSERELEAALKKLEAKEAAEQISLLASRVGDIGTQMDVFLERDRQKSESIAAMQKELKAVYAEVRDIKEYADRWKGGFYAIAGLGGAFGVAFAFWDRVRLLWAHG